MGPVHTRPERSMAEIEADRMEAAAFFARFDSRTGNPNRTRDNRRTAATEAMDWKVLMAVREAGEWEARTGQTRRDREMRRVRKEQKETRDPLLSRREDRLRPYVHPRVAQAMPAPRLHVPDKRVRERSLAEAAGWRHRVAHWGPEWRARVVRLESVPFEHWLLKNPHAGITDESRQLPVGKDERRLFHYRKGEVRPAGMTPERALQIALAALDVRGGHW
jgi:hypothetical protein